LATYNWLFDSEEDVRISTIGTIEKLISGESFQLFKDKFILEENLKKEDGKILVTDEELKKLYITYNFTHSVIKKIIAYCPNLRKVKVRDNKKRKLIKKALNEIAWDSIENENYHNLEEKGDSFFEIYFNDFNDKIPKLRVLNSKNMKRAILDDKNRYTQYVYKEGVEDSYADIATGNVNNKGQRERIIIFEKGRKIIFDQKFDDKNNLKKDSKGNQEYETDIIENRESYRNDFPIIHIPGYKKQSSEFSEIPAEQYIDPALVLDQITTDIRQINRSLGFPLIMIVDGEPVANARRTVAGIFGVKSNTIDTSNKQAQVKDVQISNDLNSIFKEFEIARNNLFDKVGLISPALLEKLNVDSSRVVQQLNLPSENKIELYVDNIIKYMQPWFKILLKENKLYDEKTDENLSFSKPKFIIKSSPFDELLYEQSEIKSTKKSRNEIYIENGDSDEDIKIRKKEINEEMGDENKDKSFAKNEVVDKVTNGQNVDKNMINT